MSVDNSEWFKSWFDTEWYHLLYCDRNQEEAQNFIEHLMNFLKPAKDSILLDLACGKGRHSVQMNQLGHHVWGVDLSEHSIKKAQAFENAKLHFAVHDMRNVFKPDYFDYILNLFTSFGYFNDNSDNLRVMESVCKGLKPGGRFVLDFLNAKKVKAELIPYQEIKKEEIVFKISRVLENNVIVKKIQFESDGREYRFEERVTAFELQDLLELFKPYNLKLKHTFGNYKLSDFDESTSERLILVTEKH